MVFTNAPKSKYTHFVFNICAASPKKPVPNVSGRKSQRYIDVDERLENDMQVTESMQNFMHKKLNQLLMQRIEFVEVAPAKSKKPKADEADDQEGDDEFSSLQLFKGSEPIVLRKQQIVVEPVVASTKSEPVRQKKPKIRKRRLPEDREEAAASSEADRIKSAVVSSDSIQSEVSNWKIRSKPDREFKYVEHASKKLYLVEPDTEFTAQRKKNNWSENKIARK